MKIKSTEINYEHTGLTIHYNLVKRNSICHSTSFDILAAEMSWDSGKFLQTILGIKRPISEPGKYIMKAKYGCENLQFIQSNMLKGVDEKTSLTPYLVHNFPKNI